MQRKTKVFIISLGNTSVCVQYSIIIARELERFYSRMIFVGSKYSNYLSEIAHLKCEKWLIRTYSNKISFILNTLFVLPVLTLRIILHRRSTFIFPQHHFWNVVLMLILKICKAEVIMAVHDDKMHAGLNTAFESFITDSQIKLAKKHVFLTKYVQDSVRKRLGTVQPSTVIQLANMSHDGMKTEVRDIDGKPVVNLLLFGRIARYKGVHLLIDAYIQLKARNEPVHLSIVGGFEEDGLLENYDKELNEVTIVDRFIPNEDVASYFNHADIVVLPYLEASQSGVLSIANTCRIPSIVTDVGGLPEMVEHLKTGLICKPDVTEIGKAISLLVNNRQLYREISVNIDMQAGENALSKIGNEWFKFISPDL